MHDVNAVLFDYGLVLTGPPDPVAWEQMKRLLRMEEVAFHAAYWRHRHDYDRGALTGLAYWEAVAGEGLESARAEALMHADTALWTQPNEPMIAWAARLQRGGIKTGILSNLGDAMETGVRATFPWLEDFSHKTFSHRLGIAKPQAEIYAHAVAGLGVDVQEVLFIDDREDNLAGAAATGMQTVRYTGHTEFLAEMQERSLDRALLLVD